MSPTSPSPLASFPFLSPCCRRYSFQSLCRLYFFKPPNSSRRPFENGRKALRKSSIPLCLQHLQHQVHRHRLSNTPSDNLAAQPLLLTRPKKEAPSLPPLLLHGVPIHLPQTTTIAVTFPQTLPLPALLLPQRRLFTP